MDRPIDLGQPQPTWTLADWLKAVHAPSVVRLIEFAESKSIIAYDEWKEQTISGWKKDGIPRREPALQMLQALVELARQNQTAVLSGDALHAHAQVFMASRACRVASALMPPEIAALLRNAPFTPDDFDLLDHVHPAPPSHLFGRQKTMARVMERLERHPVVQLTALGGDGKTALAWYAAQEARHRGLCLDFDWTTDKRSYIRSDGHLKPTNEDPLNFTRILRSMVARFQWRELEGEPEIKLERLCADRLRRGRYLIVVDNLETVDDGEYIVKHLLNMLNARAPHTPVLSRALITSRVAVQETGCAEVAIGGLESSEWQAFVRALQHELDIADDVLSEAQIAKFCQVTAGSPLFIRISLQRLAVAPDSYDEIIGDINMGQHFETFRTLFEPLFGLLTDDARWLALYASTRPSLLLADLKDQWSREYDRAYGADPAREQDKVSSFFLALGLLHQHRMIDPVGERGEYVMHALLRRYFRAKAYGR